MFDGNTGYEKVSDELRRIAVHGGWIYESWRFVHKYNDWQPFATVFVPDTRKEARQWE